MGGESASREFGSSRARRRKCAPFQMVPLTCGSSLLAITSLELTDTRISGGYSVREASLH